MHELPVMQEMLRIVGKEAQRRSLTQVSSIAVVVGELSSVLDEPCRMYFELLAEGTPCQGARLEFEHRPAMLRCEACGEEFEHRHGFDCPKCGGAGILIKGTGRELYIRSIEGL